MSCSMCVLSQSPLVGCLLPRLASTELPRLQWLSLGSSPASPPNIPPVVNPWEEKKNVDTNYKGSLLNGEKIICVTQWKIRTHSLCSQGTTGTEQNRTHNHILSGSMCRNMSHHSAYTCIVCTQYEWVQLKSIAPLTRSYANMHS